MTQVNLLPREVQQRQQTRRLTGLVIGGAGAALGVLLFVFMLQGAKLSTAEDQLASQQERNSHLQSQITDLQRFAELKQSVANREAVVAEATRGEILWSGVLRDVSALIPSDMWLTQFTGTSAQGAAPADGSAAVPVGGGMAGTIQFQGEALDHPTVALWLTRLEEVPGWANPWVTSAARGGAQAVDPASGSVPGAPPAPSVTDDNDDFVQFSGSVDLLPQVTVDGAPS